MNRRDNPTYVGDTFIINLPPFDDDPLKIYNGYTARLVGFARGIKHVFPHNTLSYNHEPGVYQCLGHPVLRLDTGNLIQLPMSHLEAQDYDLEDIRHPKNLSYWDEEANYKWLAPLPYLKCNVGDQVLIGQHGKLKDDMLGTVHDIQIKGKRVFFTVPEKEELFVVPQSSVIDVLELGEYSEFHRYCRQLDTVRRMFRYQNPGMKYADHESDEGQERSSIKETM